MAEMTLGEAVERYGTPELFGAVMSIALHPSLAVDGKPPTQHRLWRYAFGAYVIWLNATHEIQDADGMALSPFNAVICRGGWPMAVIDPAGGLIVGYYGEDELITALQTHFTELG